MGNSFGTLFRISTWGESHGGGVGVVIDGCPPRLPLCEADIQAELDRRRPGQSDITTPRKESDTATIVSGVYEGLTLGTPIAIYVPNTDQRPSAYAEMRDKFRPSHADFTYQTKFGHRNPEGGGRSSARETIGRVAAGAIAKKVLAMGRAVGETGQAGAGHAGADHPGMGHPVVGPGGVGRAGSGVEIRAYIEQIHQIRMPEDVAFPTLAEVEASPVRCPHPETAEAMIACIKAARSVGDSVGGVIRCRVRGLPVGLGAPVFDRLEADLAKAMLSLPATKGFEVGSGFAGTLLRGSEHNDLFTTADGAIRTVTNRSGGVQGGISNGEELTFRVAFKPTATILQKQETVNHDGQPVELMGKGRHDPCVVPRAVPIVEAMTALVILDHWMRHHAQCRLFLFDGAAL